MKKTTVVAVLTCSIALGSSQLRGTEASRPNVIVFLADDLGYECLSANGSESYRTPHLDRLASEGLRFTHCYSQPLCTPSRVQIMTGRYNQRNYLRFGLLDPEALTFGELFRRAGYRTLVAGKWQLLGGSRAPEHFGFEEACLWQLTMRKSRYPNPTLEHQPREGPTRTLTHLGGYGPEVVADEACEFIERHRAEPFLIYYPMILPHWPFEPTPDSADWDPAARGVLQGTGRPPYFKDMVEYTDRVVGQVVAKLDALGLRERTLVLFTGDNGTATQVTSRFRGRSIQGGKGSMTDAGTHVPLIASWPGQVPAGGVTDTLVDFSDFLPTICAAADVPIPEDLILDGRSFLPQLRGEDNPRARQWTYCWYARNGRTGIQEFARDRRYKLYRDGRFIDVAKDFLEVDDLLKTPEPFAGPGSREAFAKLGRVLAAYAGTRRDPRPVERALKARELAPVVERIEALGGRVFRKEGAVVEVVLNGRPVRDADLREIARFRELTDLSLEGTEVGNAGLRALRGHPKLEWLNLYRTRAGDKALGPIGKLKSLAHLPIGGTRITDQGLAKLENPRLVYLGLRGNEITDAGLVHLERLRTLEALHLGETRVTSEGMPVLGKLPRLTRLWLDDTAVDDRAVAALAALSALRELHLRRTKLSSEGLTRLRQARPELRVHTE